MNPTTKNRKQTHYGRFYEVGDESFPSVTNILTVIAKPALLNWMAKVEREMVSEVSAGLYLDLYGTPAITRMGWMATLESRLGTAKAGKKKLEEAGDIGTQAHSLIEWTLRDKLGIVQGAPPHISDKALWSFMAWEDWTKSVNLKPLLVEQVVYSRQFGFAGTLDLFGLVNDVPTVVDWKTGKAIYAEAHLQNAAYRHALREMGHGDAKQGMIVRLPKIDTDPEFEFAVCPEEEKLMPVFAAAKQLWIWAQIAEKAYQDKRKAAKQSSSVPGPPASIPVKEAVVTPAASPTLPPKATIPTMEEIGMREPGQPLSGRKPEPGEIKPKRTRKKKEPLPPVEVEAKTYQATNEDVPF